MVTSNDVAERAGVSQSTVSRIFRGSGAVSESTRQRVMAAAQALGYRPNPAARMLVQGRTGIIGVVVADLANPFYPQVIEVLHADLAAAGYRMTLIWDREDGVDDTSILAEAAVDGAVFMSAVPNSSSVSDFAATGRPVVQISRYHPDVSADLVVADEVTGARLVAEHLATLGHVEIGAVFGPEGSFSSRDREAAFRVEAQRHGLVLRHEWVVRVAMRHDAARKAAQEMLDGEKRPSAVYGAGDVLAIGVMDAAVAAGLQVPVDLSVVGFDDSAPAGWSMIGLTGVSPASQDMAHAAVRLLLDRLADPRGWSPRRLQFPVRLQVRGTTAPPRG